MSDSGKIPSMKTSILQYLERVHLFWGRGRFVLRTSGIKELIKRSWIQLIHLFFWYEVFYTYRNPVPEKTTDGSYLPKIDNYEYQCIHTRDEAEKLLSQGYRLHFRDGFDLHRLDKGAIAFCIFINKEIVNIGWVARTEEAKKSLTNIPFKAAVNSKEVYAGGIETGGRFKGKGLFSFTVEKRHQFYRDNKVKSSNYFISKKNVIAQKTVEKTGGIKDSQVKYLKILFWQRWRTN